MVVESARRSPPLSRPHPQETWFRHAHSVRYSTTGTENQMDFGAVLQTNPPASRTIHLAKLAEQYGFSHVWTFDSHLLWQEPYVIYSQILAQTQRIMVGPM